jgi:hypothetical protein
MDPKQSTKAGRRKRGVAAGALLAATMALGVALASPAGGGTAATSSDERQSASSPPKSPEPSPSLAELLPVLSKARTTSDALPADLAAVLSEPSNEGNSGLDAHLSRKSISLDGDGAIHLVPSKSGACVVYVGHGALSPHCMTITQLKSAEPGFASVYTGCSTVEGPNAPACGTQWIYGAAPSGTVGVRARLSDGTTVVGEVARNAYAIRVDAGAPVDTVRLDKGE